MKKVRDLRGALGEISALVRFEPEQGQPGPLEGTRLWNPSGWYNSESLARASQEDAIGTYTEEEPVSIEELIEFAPQNEEDLVRGLGGQEAAKGLLRSKVLSQGIDALGWYVSFHQTGIQWGIYLPSSSLQLLAMGAFHQLSCSLEAKFLLAFRLIHQHELFHFAADYASAQLEVLCGRPCWIPARDKLRGSGGYKILEEQLANAWMLRSLWRGKASLKLRGRSAATRDFISQMPEGYRDAHEITRSERFFLAAERLVSDYARASGAFNNDHLEQLDAARLLPFDPYLDWRHVPIFIVRDQGLSLPVLEIDLLRLALEIGETEGFRKDLMALDPKIQKAWPRTKEKLLVDATIPGLNFKHFRDRGERVYSVRLNKAHRAHLRPAPPPEGRLEAFRVGSHARIGHG